MLFVLSSERTDLEALLCCVATVKTDQPVGFTSQVTFLLPYTAVPRHLCSPPWLTEAMIGTQEPLQNWAETREAGVTAYRLHSPCSR